MRTNFLELNGAANDILQLFFGEDFKVTWLDSSKPYSNLSLAAASVWRYLGFNLVVTFGALMSYLIREHVIETRRSEMLARSQALADPNRIVPSSAPPPHAAASNSSTSPCAIP